MTERRSEDRSVASGEILLYQRGRALVKGEVCDVSAAGMRVRHTDSQLGTGTLVYFKRQDEEGLARVIWNHFEGAAAESGLLVVEPGARPAPSEDGEEPQFPGPS